MNKCKDCLHWNDSYGAAWRGVCENPRPVMYSSSLIYTDSDFGCTEWQAKPNPPRRWVFSEESSSHRAIELTPEVEAALREKGLI